jgi:hypothetical protein
MRRNKAQLEPTVAALRKGIKGGCKSTCEATDSRVASRDHHLPAIHNNKG